MASCDTEESTETTAFLSNEENVRSGASERAEEKSYLRYVLAINALTVFAMYHLLAPRTRLLELAICYSYYEVNDNSRIVSQNHWPWYDISEQECKLSPIQEKLAFLRSWGSLLEPLPALITSIFYGALAEKYGRRLTYVLGVIGLILSYMWYLLVCTFPSTISVNAILANFAFLLIGGAPASLIATMITMATDVTSESARSLSLYTLLSVQYTGSLAGSVLSSLIMHIAVLPYILALLAIALACSISSLIPQTITMRQTNDQEVSIPSCSSPNAQEICWKISVFNSISQKSHWISRNLSLAAVMLAFSLIPVRLPLMTDMVLPYASDRYQWSISNAAKLLAVSNGIDLFSALFVLPRVVSHLQVQHKNNPNIVNLYIARYCAGMLLLGSLIAGLATKVTLFVFGWIVFSTGFAIRTSIQAYASSLVNPQHIVRLYSAMAVAETAGDMLEDPLLWKAWSIGISTQNGGMGAPWFVGATSFTIVSTILWALRAEDNQRQH